MGLWRKIFICFISLSFSLKIAQTTQIIKTRFYLAFFLSNLPQYFCDIYKPENSCIVNNTDAFSLTKPSPQQVKATYGIS